MGDYDLSSLSTEGGCPAWTQESALAATHLTCFLGIRKVSLLQAKEGRQTQASGRETAVWVKTLAEDGERCRDTEREAETDMERDEQRHSHRDMGRDTCREALGETQRRHRRGWD